MSEICNGYCISGNLAETSGRKYEVSDSSGVLFTTTESKRTALDFAESLSAGYEVSDSSGVVFTTDVQPEEKPVSESPVEDAVEEKPKTSRKKK